ncbi:MAG: thiamine phosphate synthase [Burkholderiales bacterium]|nr:thiamine phosphate synthase [Burkholderiales bacterium]
MNAPVAGLYAITPDLADTGELLRRVRAALAGGIRVLQYRNKTAAPALRSAQAHALQALCSDAGVPLIINDHLDLALECGAAGLHLGSDDGDIAAARAKLGPHRLLGASCYDRIELAEAAVAAGADHVAFGSFFPSTIKPGAVRTAPELLARAKKRLAVPVVAIGGITLRNAPPLLAAGADALAVISAVFAAENIATAARNFQTLLETRHEKKPEAV